jgi:glutaredoxin 3
MLKDYLKKNNVDFEDIDVSRDYNGAMEMITISGQRGVPVADIDGNIVVGFDRSRIQGLLNLRS